MTKRLPAIMILSTLAFQGGLYGQAVKEMLKGAKPATGVGEDLVERARQPRYYKFRLDEPIPVSCRSVVADAVGNRSVALEVRTIAFTLDPKDNHLTAVAAIVCVGVRPVKRAIHIALYDKHKRLLGTGIYLRDIEASRTGHAVAPIGTPMDVTIDCGKSPRYFTIDSFQAAVTGRGRSEYRYSSEDVDELIRRLRAADDPEAQQEAGTWLIRIGEPCVARLSGLAVKDGPAANASVWVLGEIGGPKVAPVLGKVLADTQRSEKDRCLAALGLGRAGKEGVKVLGEQLEREDRPDVLGAIFAGLAKSRERQAAVIFCKCMRNPRKYYGKTRVQLITSAMTLGNPIVVPDLIEALRDPSPRVRPAAASALERVTKHSVPVKWMSGSSEMAWLNAPLDVREAAVKEWQRWWEANRERFIK